MAQGGGADWEDLRVLLAVLRKGGFAAAAPMLGVVQVTVRRRMADLEAKLGHPLFVDSSRALRATPEAQALAAVAEAMDEGARTFVRTASAERDDPRGLVRVLTTEAVGQQLLIPVFAGLRRRYPDLAIELVLTEADVDANLETADIALLRTWPASDGLIVSDLGHIDWGLYAHRDYVAARGQPDNLGDLTRFDLIGPETERGAQHHLASLRLALTDPCFKVRTDSHAARFAAMCAGSGIGWCQTPLAAGRPELIRVLPEFSPKFACWIASWRNQAAVRRIRIVRESISEGIKAYSGQG